MSEDIEKRLARIEVTIAYLIDAVKYFWIRKETSVEKLKYAESTLLKK